MSSYVNFYLRNRGTGFTMPLTDYSRSNPMYECVEECFNCYENPIKLDDDALHQLNVEFDRLIAENEDYIAQANQRIADLKEVSANGKFSLDEVVKSINDERDYINSIQEDLVFYKAQKDQLNFMASFATYDEDYNPDGTEVYFGIEIGTKNNKLVGLDATED